MFGSRRNKIDGKKRDIFDHIYQKRVTFETSVNQVEEGNKRVYKDICQVMTNSNELVTNTMINIEDESALIHKIDEFSKELHVITEEHEQLKAEIEHQLHVSAALVEENKHFTTPAKYLMEVPSALKESNQFYDKKLDEMAEYGKQMSVLALNAAIEAGRIGENGMPFVLAAEEIRQAAVTYEKAALAMKDEIKQAQNKVAEMEETITHLVSLLKDNNMGTAKLFKTCQETYKFIKQSQIRDYSDDLIELRDSVVKIRNLDEEIAKCAERSKIQLSDIQEDIQNQKHDLADMESDLLHLLDSTEELFG